MDNQQVTQADLGWLGGIIDGEGSIAVRWGRKINQFSPRLQIYNTNPIIIQRCCNILDSIGVAYNVRERGEGGFEGSKKQCWVILTERLGAAALAMNHLLPHIYGKRAQAILLKRFLDSRLSRLSKVKRNSDAPYSKEEMETLADIYQLNGDQRGTSETIRATIREKFPVEDIVQP